MKATSQLKGNTLEKVNNEECKILGGAMKRVLKKVTSF